MTNIYISSQGTSLKMNANRLVVEYTTGEKKFLPFELIESIYLLGNINISKKVIDECLKKGIVVTILSRNGSYFGRIMSTSHVNVKRQRKQAKLYYNEDFRLEFSKKVINSKISNQRIFLMRKIYGKKEKFDEELYEMKKIQKEISKATKITEIMGYEGCASKIYFSVLGKLVKEDFKFKGRSKRPPRDEFNSLISLGYTFLLNEIYYKLEKKGLNPYFGFMHSDKENHPTLASDLIEEWRSVIIDSIVMSMINKGTIKIDNFKREGDAVIINKIGIGKLVNAYNIKMDAQCKYLIADNNDISYREMLDYQINNLAKSIDEENVENYNPIRIR